MPFEWTALSMVACVALGALVFVTGGIRFRRWAVDDRPGIPRFAPAVETVLLWLLYSGIISIGIVVVRQTMRHF